MDSRSKPSLRKVRSKFKKSLTFSQHYEEVLEYFETKRDEALRLTESNPTLQSFIRSWGLFMVANRNSGVSVGLKKGGNKLVEYQKDINFKIYNSYGKGGSIYDTVECQDRLSDFMNSVELLRGALISYYFFPKFAKKDMMVEFIQHMVCEGLNWEFDSAEKVDKLSLINASRTLPSDFMLLTKDNILIAIGNHQQIKKHIKEILSRHFNSLLLVGLDKSDNDYTAIKDRVYQEKNIKDIFVWSGSNLGFSFYVNIRVLASWMDKVLSIGTSNVYKLGEVLSNTIDQQHELIIKLRQLRTGKGKEYESIIQEVITFCFSDEFSPFELKSQVENIGRNTRKDYVLENNDPKHHFWKDRLHNGTQLILFECKNYTDALSAGEIGQIVNYLNDNSHYGNFAIIFSRCGVKDEAYLISKMKGHKAQYLIPINEDDLISMIIAKSESRSPSDIINQKYKSMIAKL